MSSVDVLDKSYILSRDIDEDYATIIDHFNCESNLVSCNVREDSTLYKKLDNLGNELYPKRSISFVLVVQAFCGIHHYCEIIIDEIGDIERLDPTSTEPRTNRHGLTMSNGRNIVTIYNSLSSYVFSGQACYCECKGLMMTSKSKLIELVSRPSVMDGWDVNNDTYLDEFLISNELLATNEQFNVMLSIIPHMKFFKTTIYVLDDDYKTIISTDMVVASIHDEGKIIIKNSDSFFDDYSHNVGANDKYDTIRKLQTRYPHTMYKYVMSLGKRFNNADNFMRAMHLAALCQPGCDNYPWKLNRNYLKHFENVFAYKRQAEHALIKMSIGLDRCSERWAEEFTKRYAIIISGIKYYKDMPFDRFHRYNFIHSMYDIYNKYLKRLRLGREHLVAHPQCDKCAYELGKITAPLKPTTVSNYFNTVFVDGFPLVFRSNPNAGDESTNDIEPTSPWQGFIDDTRELEIYNTNMQKNTQPMESDNVQENDQPTNQKIQLQVIPVRSVLPKSRFHHMKNHELRYDTLFDSDDGLSDDELCELIGQAQPIKIPIKDIDLNSDGTMSKYTRRQIMDYWRANALNKHFTGIGTIDNLYAKRIIEPHHDKSFDEC